jgi:ubiquitin-protein ligase
MNKTMKTGLIFFDLEIIVKSQLVPVAHDFQKSLIDAGNPMRRGMTAIFLALQKAIDILVEQKKYYINSQPRIILLTDGEDSIGKVEPYNILKQLCQHQILLDTFVISDDIEPRLIALAKLAGGGVFIDQNPEKIYVNFLRDEFIDISRRKFEITSNPVSSDAFEAEINSICNELKLLKQTNKKESDKQSFPSNFHVHPVPATISNKFLTNSLALTRFSSNSIELNQLGNSDSGIEKFYILQELHLIYSQDNPNFKVYPIEKEFNIWKILLLGPNGSPYQNCWWYLSISFPNAYPNYPPTILFVHPPYHYNISEQGTIHLDLLDQNYNRNLRVYDLLMSILKLLEYSDPNVTIDFERENVKTDLRIQKGVFEPDKIPKYNDMNSKTSIDEWLKEWNIEDLPQGMNPKITLPPVSYTPHSLRCPITQEKMKDPVKATNGIVYDRNNLAQWLRNSSNDEISKQGLQKMDPNQSAQWLRDTKIWQKL